VEAGKQRVMGTDPYRHPCGQRRRSQIPAGERRRFEVNHRNGRLYNVNTGAANLSVLNGETNGETNGVINTIGLVVDPFAIAINNFTGTVFVGLRGSGRLVKIDE
jgi:hypothetical protein